jgi:hypothetical protein
MTNYTTFTIVAAFQARTAYTRQFRSDIPATSFTGLTTVHVFAGPSGELLGHTSPGGYGVSWTEKVFPAGTPVEDVARQTLMADAGPGGGIISDLTPVDPEYKSIKGRMTAPLSDQQEDRLIEAAAGQPAKVSGPMIAAMVAMGGWMFGKGEKVGPCPGCASNDPGQCPVATTGKDVTGNEWNGLCAYLPQSPI